MIRSAICLAGVALACGALQAQTTNPVITEMKASYTSVKNNLIKAAEKAPEDVYNFKPTPDIRTFGELIAHIAQAQYSYCGRAKGETKQADLGTKSKADLVAAFKASFDLCDSAWDGVTDANATEMAGTGRGAASKLGTLIRNSIHDNEEYGYLSVYMRLKGIVPPSSEAAPGRGGR